MLMAKQALSVIYQLAETPDRLRDRQVFCVGIQETETVDAHIVRICFLAGEVVKHNSIFQFHQNKQTFSAGESAMRRSTVVWQRRRKSSTKPGDLYIL